MSVIGRVVTIVALVALCASTAFASPFQAGINVNLAMAGNTGIARAVDEASWAVNPAGLSFLDGALDELAADAWQKICGGAIDIDGDLDLTTFNLAAKQFGRPYGIGLGYIDVFDTDIYGVGFGRKIGRGDIGWGINYMRAEPEFGTGSNVISGALYGQWDYDKDPVTSVLRYGAVVRDVTEEWFPHRTYDVGLATNYWGIDWGVDLWDLSDELDRTFRVGATKTFTNSLGDWTIGAGLDEGDPTAGLSYQWVDTNQSIKAGIAWQENDAAGADDGMIFGVSYLRNLR